MSIDYEHILDVATRTAAKFSNGSNPAASSTATGEIEGLSDDARDRLAVSESLRIEVERELIRRDARKIADEVEANRIVPVPFDAGMLDSFEDEPTQWRITDFHPKGGRVLVVAQRKVGKTTFGLDNARANIHGDIAYLGQFMATPIIGNVGYLNYELGRATFNRWAREARIDEARIYINHLRGKPNPLATERDRRRLVDDFKKHDVKFFYVDPAARAFTGDNIDNTTQMVEFTNILDRVAEEAGIEEMVVMNHTGWDKERGRNSSVLEDWADVIVRVVKGDGEESETRFLSAIGRDVEIPEDRLIFDQENRTFTLAGSGGRHKGNRIDRMVPAVVDILKRHRPGMNGSQIEDQLRLLGFRPSKGDGNKAAAQSLSIQQVEAPGTQKLWQYVDSSANARWDDDKASQ